MILAPIAHDDSMKGYGHSGFEQNVRHSSYNTPSQPNLQVSPVNKELPNGGQMVGSLMYEALCICEGSSHNIGQRKRYSQGSAWRRV